MSRLSLQMPISVLMNTYHKAGFGMPTNLGLVGEQSGTLPYNRKRWADIERNVKWLWFNRYNWHVLMLLRQFR